MLRQFKRLGARTALGVLAWAMLASSPAQAQSFFEKLFGLGDLRPQSTLVSPHPRPGAIPVERGPQSLVREARRDTAGRDGGGGAVQTMCVRTCDGYYWPVHFPVSRHDLTQDANICEASCGAQAKLYTREGPGTDAEEMRDANGQSYGASATAFLYRRGLVNGCSCRPMPWSNGERARHEGYALAEAETAIRVAQAEAQKAGEARIASELAEAKIKQDEQDKMLAMAAVETASAAGSALEPGVGPAEAAAVAAFAANPAEPAVAIGEEHGRRRKQKRVDGYDRERATKTKRLERGPREAVVQTSRLPRGVTAQTAAPRNAVFAATGPKFWWAQ